MSRNILLTRGRVAKQLNINAETLRFYESEKLIKQPSRLNNNYRTYDNETVSQLKFILTAKELGFSLEEIRELLHLSIHENTNRKKVRAIATQKSQLISEKITQLKKMKKILDQLIKTCETTDQDNSPCPILQCIQETK